MALRGVRTLQKKEEPHESTTAARDRRRHPNGALQPDELPRPVVVPRSLSRRRKAEGLPLLGHRAWHRGHRCRRRIMDDEKVRLVGHHHY